jgi:serine/threonine-protein kinase
MHVDPAKRFATAEEFRVAIEQYLFVSGERADSAAIASIMQRAFADERAAMNRMIDLQLKDADYSESLVRQLRPVPASEDPTTVADLSELVESSRADLPTRSERETNPGWNRSLRGGSNNTVWWIVAALVAAGAAAAYLVPRMQPPGVPAASAPAPVASAPPPAISPPVVQPAPPVAAPEIVAPAVVASLPVAAEPSQPNESERAARRARRAAAEDTESEESTGGGFLFGFLDNEDGDEAPSDDVDDEAVPSDKPAASLRIVPSTDGELSKQAAEDKALQPAPVDVGEDLRRLRKEERRRLDLEDPFQ